MLSAPARLLPWRVREYDGACPAGHAWRVIVRELLFVGDILIAGCVAGCFSHEAVEPAAPTLIQGETRAHRAGHTVTESSPASMGDAASSVDGALEGLA
jgi:hypothetical protein